MYGYHIVAVYPSHTAAEDARRKLIQAGVHDSSIHLSSDVHEDAIIGDRDSHHDEDQGFFHWLFGDSSPAKERDWYSSHLQDGRTALSVLVHEDEEHLSIAEIMVRTGGMDLEDESTAMASKQRATKSGYSTGAAGRARDTGDEEVIPVYKEELAVGKKTTENRYRVRAHVVERPVQENVELRDERVIVERRPVSGDRYTTGQMNTMRDREYEVIERHEEPVVQKKQRAVEEVVVRKDSKSRTQTVRDTVRETEVEMDGKKVAGGGYAKRAETTR